MTKLVVKSLTVAVLAMSALAANAADASVTGNVITGTGIANGGFTVGTGNNIEIGLRARERYGSPVGLNFQPTNNTYSNNDGTYNHAPGGFTSTASPLGTAGGTRASWNFDWSINTNQIPSAIGAATTNVSAYTYRLSMDFDPGVGTNFQTFDLINAAAFFDHSFGNNATAQSAGVEAANAAGYDNLKNNNNLVQNSWNYDFFDSVTFPFDPNAQGTYTIKLEAFGTATGIALASSTINVNVGAAAVPEPGSMALVGLALAGLAVMRRRRKV